MIGNLGERLKLLHSTSQLETVHNINFSISEIRLKLFDLVFKTHSIIMDVRPNQ